MSLFDQMQFQFAIALQSGPTELFLPSSGEAEAGMNLWLFGGGVVVVLVLVVIWMVGMSQRRTDPRELAFRSLSRKLKLTQSQASAVRSLSESTGRHPVGLVLCPSAIRDAANQGS